MQFLLLKAEKQQRIKSGCEQCVKNGCERGPRGFHTAVSLSTAVYGFHLPTIQCLVLVDDDQTWVSCTFFCLSSGLQWGNTLWFKLTVS